MNLDLLCFLFWVDFAFGYKEIKAIGIQDYILFDLEQ